MSSRDEILTAVRRHLPQSTPLPELTGPWIAYDDPIAQFTSVQEMIGGRCVRVPDDAALKDAIETLPQFLASTKTLSLVPQIGPQSMDAIDDPHALHDVDLAILPGRFAVAENAAVWISDAGIRHRVIYFLCQHLVLVVPAALVVHNMSEAYERIRINGPQFGTFLAGPSKTADIEQSLVIGAHGPKSLTVFLVG